jgi:3-hydroxymyristoyl/3-hydroxydecanoyl-(acyl carrier protein) dehydratase
VSADAPRRGVVERVFQADHPSSRGHFEGNPIIPGAVLLSETVLAIERSIGAPSAPFAISSAKFRHPARPGDRVVIEFSWTGGELSFSCAVEGRVVLSGQLSCPGPSTHA